MNRSALTTTIGFVLLIVGFLSLILKMVGVHLSFLYWIEILGGLTANLIRVSFILIGLLLIYVSRTKMDV